MTKMKIRKLMAAFFLISVIFSMCSVAFAQQVYKIRMSYNGPPNAEKNAVHLFAKNLQRLVSIRTNDQVQIVLYPHSQLGAEEQRMHKTLNQPLINVASFAGLAPVFPQIYAANIPFMFKSYSAAHHFFDNSRFWQKAQESFEQETGSYLLEAVEEGGFLAITNSKRPIHKPEDFKGLKFRAMAESQKTIYKVFGASGTSIPWGKVYSALENKSVDGQMNPPMYILLADLFEVQKYMTLANIAYSPQFLVVNGKWLDNLPAEFQKALIKAAHDANEINRIEVETLVTQRIRALADKGLEIYHPDAKEMQAFQDQGQPAYLKWLQKQVDQEWIKTALDSAKKSSDLSVTCEKRLFNGASE
jgi:tripartite ATP-independent transporter DctP family solute receptor